MLDTLAYVHVVNHARRGSCPRKFRWLCWTMFGHPQESMLLNIIDRNVSHRDLFRSCGRTVRGVVRKRLQVVPAGDTGTVDCEVEPPIVTSGLTDRVGDGVLISDVAQ